MMLNLSVWVTWALTAFVVLACICRIAALEPGNHRLLWRVMYILFAAAALDVAVNAQALAKLSLWLPLFVTGGLAANLWLTRHQWTSGAAEITKLRGST